MSVLSVSPAACLPDNGSQGERALTRRCLATHPGRVVGRNPSACSSRPLNILSPKGVRSEHSNWGKAAECLSFPPTLAPRRGMRTEWGSFLLAVTPLVQLILLLVGRKSHTLPLSSLPRAFPPGGSNQSPFCTKASGFLALLSSCSWAQGTQQVEHSGSKTTQPGSKAQLPATGLTRPQLWLCQSPTSKWVETGPTKMPHTTNQSLGKQLKAGSVSRMWRGEPHRGLLSHIFSQQHPTWEVSGRPLSDTQYMTPAWCVWEGGVHNTVSDQG